MEYAKKAAKLSVQLYFWHPTPSTIHTILIHGSHYIKAIYIPIGQLSEEAIEVRNKHFHLFWQLSLKFSGISCNHDVFNKLLLGSDPILTGKRPTIRKNLGLQTHEKQSSKCKEDDDELFSNEKKSIFSVY